MHAPTLGVWCRLDREHELLLSPLDGAHLADVALPADEAVARFVGRCVRDWRGKGFPRRFSQSAITALLQARGDWYQRVRTFAAILASEQAKQAEIAASIERMQTNAMAAHAQLAELHARAPIVAATTLTETQPDGYATPIAPLPVYWGGVTVPAETPTPEPAPISSNATGQLVPVLPIG